MNLVNINGSFLFFRLITIIAHINLLFKMTPRKKRKHLDENTKNRIAGLRQSNLIYKDILKHLQKKKCGNIFVNYEANWFKLRN